MSQNNARKQRRTNIPSNDNGVFDAMLIIRLIIASVIFAVSLIIDMPDFMSITLLVLTAAVAGYDIVLTAASCVEEGDFFSVPVVVVIISAIAYLVDFPEEGAALLILYQLGIMLIAYAEEHTRKASLELLSYQEPAQVSRMDSCVRTKEGTATDIEATMRQSAGFILKLAMLFAVAFAVVLLLVRDYSFSIAVHRALTIILVATPMSVVVSIPLAATVGLCYSSQQGITFESAAAMEAMAETKIAIFDKAGIFADECPKIIAMYSDILDSSTFLNMVAHCVYYSDQPIASAVAAVNDHDYNLGIISDFRDIPGYGVELLIEGMRAVFATKELYEERGVVLPEEEAEAGQTFYLTVEDRYIGSVTIAAEINPELETLVPQMNAVNIPRCVLLTEDSKERGRQFAEMLGFREMHSGCTQDTKLAIVQEIVKKSKNAVLYVYSDAPETHSAAAVDMKVGRKTKLADALVDPASLSDIPFAKLVSLRFREVAIENAVFAFVIKGILIFLSMIGYCNLWFAMFLDLIAAVATILNTIRVTNESLVSKLRNKTAR